MINAFPKHSGAAAIQIKLPQLQSVIRYYDDFSDETYSIPNPEHEDEWDLIFDGQTSVLEFRSFEPKVRLLIKHWCAFMLCRELAPATVKIRFEALRNVSAERILELLSVKAEAVKTFWRLLSAEYPGRYGELEAAMSLLRFLCSASLLGWNPDRLVLLSHLPLPKVDKYAAVRNGNVFLSAQEEAVLVGNIDELASLLRGQPANVSDVDLQSKAILICAYQFGLRRKQIAMLRVRDVRIWNAGLDQGLSVHLTFMMIKQRSADRRLPMTRSVKHEWRPIFLELLHRRRTAGAEGNERFFLVSSAHDVGRIISETTCSILGHPRSGTELRHTAAQRLVDAGAGQEELAAFLGHSDLNTGLVYFRTSASQAERVNQALGISEIYNRVVKIAHDRFISADELSRLKAIQQVGGVPHGIPITGIGGCSGGQPACPYNPVMSCYGCPKFMPVNNSAVHIQVLADLRGVVQSFQQASRGDTSSPTYMQLRQTITAVQGVVGELTEGQT